jgi:hypothetical protein
VKAWSLHHNWRDYSGNNTSYAIPAGRTERKLELTDLASTDRAKPLAIRPRKDSPVATQGAGTVDPSLPAYGGANPPDGVAPWDWDRTWRARFARGPADPGAKEKSDK